LKSQLKKEKGAYDNLPDELDGKLYFKFSKICDITNAELERVIKPAKNLIRSSADSDSKLANLVIKYIPEQTLEGYLCNFVGGGDDCESVVIISVKKFISLLKSWLILVYRVKRLHELNFVHLDIMPSNIIYYLNNMYLIDLESSTYKRDEMDVLKEYIDLYRVVSDILVVGYNNSKISRCIDNIKAGILTRKSFQINLSVFSNAPPPKVQRNTPVLFKPLSPPHQNTRELLLEIMDFVNELISRLNSTITRRTKSLTFSNKMSRTRRRNKSAPL
jgi:serine/threonine protein kinase